MSDESQNGDVEEHDNNNDNDDMLNSSMVGKNLASYFQQSLQERNEAANFYIGKNLVKGVKPPEKPKEKLDTKSGKCTIS